MLTFPRLVRGRRSRQTTSPTSASLHGYEGWGGVGSERYTNTAEDTLPFINGRVHMTTSNDK